MLFLLSEAESFELQSLLDDRLKRVELLSACVGLSGLLALRTEEIIDSMLLASAAGFSEIESF
jgi:hypothetical protein